MELAEIRPPGGGDIKLDELLVTFGGLWAKSNASENCPVMTMPVARLLPARK